jgi:hypothetical protein
MMNEEQMKALLEEKATTAQATERTATGTSFAACTAILNVEGDRCDSIATVAVRQETEKWVRITRGCDTHAAAYKNVKAAVSHAPITVAGACEVIIETRVIMSRPVKRGARS